VKSKFLQVAQYLLLLVLGLLLSWSFFKDLNFDNLLQVLKTGDFSWFYMVMLVSLFVYTLRTLRWLMLIKAMGYKAAFPNALSALSIGYFVSFIVPRLGEVTRCLSVKKKHNIPFMKLLGTVIIERVIDILCLLILLALTIFLQFNHIIEFVKENIWFPIYEGIIKKVMAGNQAVIVVVLVVTVISIFLFFYFKKYIKEKSPKIIVKFVEGLKDGITSIAKLEQKGLFIFYTVCIWLGYYLMTYFWFFVFKETSVLGWGACLTIVAIGTIGRSVPIQGGGMGAYHYLVNGVVLLYGLGGVYGKTLATLIHAGQTFFTFAMGLVGLIIFFVAYWRKR